MTEPEVMEPEETTDSLDEVQAMLTDASVELPMPIDDTSQGLVTDEEPSPDANIGDGGNAEPSPAPEPMPTTVAQGEMSNPVTYDAYGMPTQPVAPQYDPYAQQPQGTYPMPPQGQPEPTQAFPYGGGEIPQVPPIDPMTGQPQQTKVPWYMTTPARIALCILGILLICRGVMKIGSAIGSNKGNVPDDTSKPGQVVQSPKATDSKDGKKDDEKNTKKDDKTDGTGKDGGDLIDGGDGQDIIIADPDDVVISDPDDIVIRTDGKDDKGNDVSYGGGEKFDSWAAECTDKNGNPTVYAVSELKGWQLETLCQEKGLKWNKVEKKWEGKDYALIVYDKSHKPIDDQAIAKLGKGCDEPSVVYEIQLLETPDVEEAYKNSAKVMTEDQERVTDGTLYAVASGPSMKRMFIFAYQRTVLGGSAIQVTSSAAIEEGTYDSFMNAMNDEDVSYGDSAREVWEHWAGRKLGSSH